MHSRTRAFGHMNEMYKVYERDGRWGRPWVGLGIESLAYYIGRSVLLGKGDVGRNKNHCPRVLEDSA